MATIIYQNNVIAKLAAGEVATVECEGQKMLGDLIFQADIDTVSDYDGAVVIKREVSE